VTNEVIQNCLDGPLKNLATIFVSSDPGSWLESCDKVIEMKVGTSKQHRNVVIFGGFLG
jgi:ABC-type sulfate/molybdate transport systems ATPase subunit